VTEYDHQLALHDELRALLEQIRDGKAYFRNPAALNIPNPPVVGPKRAIDRDRLLCAMFNRLATTHTAVRRLAELGFGDDAYALCRNMIENAIYLMWILQDTGRLDVYYLHKAPLHKRLAEVLSAHYPGAPEFDDVSGSIDDWVERASKDVFNDEWLKWARFQVPGQKPDVVQPSGMMHDLDPAAVPAGSKHFVYDFAYFETSLYVHTLAPVLEPIARKLDGPFYEVLEAPIRDKVDVALCVSNVFVATAMRALAAYLNLNDLRLRVDEIGQRLEKSVSDIARPEGATT